MTSSRVTRGGQNFRPSFHFSQVGGQNSYISTGVVGDVFRQGEVLA